MGHPTKIGTVQTVDMQTGEVISEKKNAFTLLGPPPDKCQECAVDHPYDRPHDRDSLFYQMHFHARHGRWPTWTDAMAHCTPEMKELTREALVNVLRRRGLEIPADLVGDAPAGR